MPYKWLNPVTRDLTDDMQVLAAIDKKQWSAGKKNLYASFYLNQKERYESEGRSKDFDLDVRDLKSWKRTSAFRKFVAKDAAAEKEKFRMAGMVSSMAAALFFFFCRAVWDGNYLVNFSVDAIVGVASLFVLILQLRIKYREIRMYGNIRDYVMMDVLTAVICIMFKIMLPANMDLSLFVLLINYFMEKKRFSQTMDQFEREN